MKHRILLSFVALCSCVHPGHRRDSLDASARDVAEVLAAEAAKIEGYRRADTALVGAHLAPDYVTVTVQDHGTGFGDRAKGIRAMLEHRATGAPIEDVTADSIRVRVYGDVAILTAMGTISMRWQDGTPFVIRDVYTDVWHRREGRWWLVHTQHGTTERQVGARRYEPSWRLMGISVPLLAAASSGADAVLARYKALKDTARANWRFNADELNTVGYWFLQRAAPQDAIKVFVLNTEEYPNNGNSFDSLGEAYLVAADTVRAIENYRRSIQLDSTNTNAVAVLRKLGALPR